jgi:hypothetical protein
MPIRAQKQRSLFSLLISAADGADNVHGTLQQECQK